MTVDNLCSAACQLYAAVCFRGTFACLIKVASHLAQQLRDGAELLGQFG
ncbi:hypothetical protein [Streptomyces sp. NPDC058086]